MNIDILNPSGFCGGVINVLKLIDYVVETHKDQSIYCDGQVVHNNDVNEQILKKGVKVLTIDKKKAVESIESGVVVFSAHGTDERIVRLARNKGLIVYNAVCPFVDKSFEAIKNKHNEGYDIIYIGKKGHDEANAAMSIIDNIHFVSNLTDVDELDINNSKIAIINQTTLSILDIEYIYKKIQEKYPNAIIIDEICNTTRLRQQNLLKKAKQYDVVIVVGDKSSSNTMSLFNIATKENKNTYMVLNEKEVENQWFVNVNSVLIVSGASTPNVEIDKIVKKIKIN